MKRIKLDFNSYSDGALLLLAKAVVLALTGNLFFPALSNPTLAQFQTGINDYEAALAAAADRGKNSVAAKDASKAELINLLFKMALQCMQQADGNLQALISTAFPLSKSREPQPPLGVPAIEAIEAGINSGELQVNLFSLPGSRTFVYQYAQDPLPPNVEWQSTNSTVTRQIITQLETGKRYWFKVVAYGTNNQMTISDPVLSKIVQ